MPDFKALRDQVADYILDAIQKGKFKEGDHVVELQIAETLELSRTPVREALLKLAEAGYLEKVERRGFFVRSFDEQRAKEIFQILGPLDGRAALLATPHLTDSDMSQLQFLYESMELAISSKLTERYFELQDEFHATYRRKCDNKLLIDTLEGLLRQFSSKSYHRKDEESLQNLRAANEEHKKLLAYFEARDAKGAEAWVRDVHWSLAYAHFAIW